MKPEERFERIEAQLGFLASHLAQFSASVDTLCDVSARHDTQIIQLTDVVVSMARVVEQQGRRTDERLGVLAESQRRTDEQFRLLGESQRRTDERLSTLIDVVERYFSNGRN
jgi:hypothetical protein